MPSNMKSVQLTFGVERSLTYFYETWIRHFKVRRMYDSRLQITTIYQSYELTNDIYRNYISQ